MIITCPACAKRYQLKDGSIGQQGRKVKCVTCAHTWHQEPISLPSGAAPMTPGKKPHHQIPSKTRKLIWALPVLLITTGVLFLLVAHERLVTYYPPLHSFYDAIGLSAGDPYEGIDIKNAKTSFVEHQGQKMVRITGEIVNLNTIPMPAPLLYVKALGTCADDPKQKDCEVAQWEHRLSKTKLLPGEHLHFETDPHTVPPKAERLTIKF